MSEKAGGNDVHARIMTHEQMLAESGFDICSPITGSMRPMIRVRRDSALFVPLTGRLKKYDVALYRRNGYAVMHRVLKVLPDGYVIRGDNANGSEWVADDQVIGVMQGFYRDEQYISCGNPFYRLYASIWPKLHPLLMLYKRLHRLAHSIRWRIRKSIHKVLCFVQKFLDSA